MVTWCLKVTSRLTVNLFFWKKYYIKKVLQITLNKIAPISLKMIKLLIKRIKRLLVPLQIAPLKEVFFFFNLSFWIAFLFQTKKLWTTKMLWTFLTNTTHTHKAYIYLQGRNRFLFQMKTVEFAFEINWPLALLSCKPPLIY